MAIKVINLRTKEVGIHVGAEVKTSLDFTKDGFEMVLGEPGVFVKHKKLTNTYLIPFSNIASCELQIEETIAKNSKKN